MKVIGASKAHEYMASGANYSIDALGYAYGNRRPKSMRDLMPLAEAYMKLRNHVLRMHPVLRHEKHPIATWAETASSNTQRQVLEDLHL